MFQFSLFLTLERKRRKKNRRKASKEDSAHVCQFRLKLQEGI